MLQAGLGAAQASQSATRLSGDKQFEAHSYERGALFDPRELLRVGQELVVNGDGGTHEWSPA
jgi:hypothetical protein